MKKALVLINKVKPSLIESQFRRMGIEKLVDYTVVEGDRFDPLPFKTSADQLTVFWANKAQVVEVLAKNPNIKWVHSLLAGVDGIMSPELIAHPAPLTNAKGAYSASLGEWVIFAMLWHTKKVDRWAKLKAQAKWAPAEVGMCSDKTLGIIGYGDIGIQCAKHVKGAFGSRVIGMKRDPASVNELGKKSADEIVGNDKLDYLLKESDFVVNSTPLTAETRGLCNTAFFKKMKKTAVFVNIGRGPTVNEKDLAECLKNGTIAGAVLDVFDVEPLVETSPLWGLDNVYITPHCADLTYDYMERSFDIFGENMANWVKGKPLVNHVNKSAGY